MKVSHSDLQPLADTAREALRASHQKRITLILDYIHFHLAERLDLNRLGKIAHFSPSHLNVVFRGLVGESVYQHIRRLRLERAASLLRVTRAPILEVALACGFQTHEAFSTAFRTAFRCSPRTFRKRHHLSCELAAPTNLHYNAANRPSELIPTPDLGRSLNVRIVELPAQRLACHRRMGCYTEAHWAWPPLLWWAWQRGRLKNDPVLYGLTYDDDQVTPASRQRYDAAIRVEDDFAGHGTIHALTLDPGLFAVTTVRGSFADYWRTSEAFLYQWMPTSGFALRWLYTLDRYHLPANLSSPWQVFELGRKHLHVDLYLPIDRGPFDRIVPS